MAVSNTSYGKTIAKLLNGTHVWGTGTWKMSLILESEVPDEEDDFRDDLSEATGQTQQTVTCVAAAAATGVVTLDISDATVTFSGVDGAQSIGGAAIYLAVGSAATDPILSLCDFTGGAVAADGVNNIVVTPGAGGILQITYS